MIQMIIQMIYLTKFRILLMKLQKILQAMNLICNRKMKVKMLKKNLLLMKMVKQQEFWILQKNH